MRYLRLVLIVFACVLAAADLAAGEDKLPDGRMSITLNGGMDAYIETIDGERYGFSPFTQETYSEISGILKTSGEEKTTIELPADQLYGLWLERPEGVNPKQITTEIRTAEWRAGLGYFRNNTDTVDLLINPRSTFSENGPVFNKISVNAAADSLPEMRFEFPEEQGDCKMNIKTGFDTGTAVPTVTETLTELVVTYYPDESIVSVWIVSSAVEDDAFFSGSTFLIGISLACENEDQIVRNKVFPKIAMNENGIFFLDLDDFRSGGEAYFEGDLDGDDIYEVEPKGF